MKQILASLLVCALLAACGSGSNPFANTDTGEEPDPGEETPDEEPTTETPVTVPAAVAGDVRNVTYDAANGTLIVEGVNLDDVPYSATYRRAPGLDQDGYVAFTIQEDPLDRHYTAYARESSDGSVRATAVASTGPRNRSLMGTHFERDGDYDPPEVTEDSGLVTYAGRYVAVTNIGDPNGSDLLPTGVTDPELLVSQAMVIHGDAFINADFADNTVEGNIYNRELLDSDLNVVSELPSVVLVMTDIEANGSFTGTVEYDKRDPLSGTTSNTAIGTYSGVFGGTDASSVAGGVQLDEFDGVEDNLGLEAELESGVFVLDQCGTPGSPAVCNSVNPDVGSP
ncbi:thymidylate synthase [Roseovarius sp.]|uniref:thymidylate synthase n=1 Tax=Roseovarius sp. TaxID=1486281 RepID=UPI00263516D2|nr:thymidylate synthase [Roseovarius sp.]MDM8166497.1 thymidylate synthase [Roseovarius sp.]